MLFTLYYFDVFSHNYDNEIKRFNHSFENKTQEIDLYLNHRLTELKQKGFIGKWKDLPTTKSTHFHVFRNDSLVFWNTNQLPIRSFADLHFPSNGIFHLQNGWYYGKTISYQEYILCASFLIKKDYPFENDELKNEFVKPFKLSFSSFINLVQEEGYPVFDSHQQYVFSIIPNEYQTATEYESIVLMILLLASFVFVFLWVNELNQTYLYQYPLILPGVILLLRFLSLKYLWLGFMHDTAPFQSSLYGTSEWFPNFFEYLLNTVVIFYVLVFLRTRIKRLLPKKNSYMIAYGLLLSTYAFWNLIMYLTEGLVQNSSIPLNIDQLFSLNTYSFFAITSLGLLFYGYFLYVRDVIKVFIQLDLSQSKLALFSFVFGMIYWIYDLIYGYQIIFSGLFPLLFIGIIIYYLNRKKNTFGLAFGLLFLSLIALVVAENLASFNERKDKSERELFANQLATEQDIVTEVEYQNLAENLKKDDLLKNLVRKTWNIKASDLQETLERLYFNGFWERYELSFFFFDYQNESVIRYSKENRNTYEYMAELTKNHGTPSEIDSNMYFINDYTNQFAYIIQQPIFDQDSLKGTLFCTLKSKKIPEAIGFPRLLISSKAKVFSSLENYSIAKYHDGQLTRKYGEFNYPSNVRGMIKRMSSKSRFFNYENYNHILLNKSKKDAVVLSNKNYSVLELLTSFSYLFSFYGILILPLLFQSNQTPLYKRTLSLAVKIQLVLIGLVFISLLAFGWGSGVFVSNQYNQYTDDIIREKMMSIHVEMKTNFHDENYLSIDKDANSLSFLLKKLSKVFVTDINVYDTKGMLLATSRQRIFNLGLLSEQINPEAFYALQIRDKSEFIHQEDIGELNYSSAYLPFYNGNGNLLGYLNLQHFGQQNDFENQIQQFLVAIINVFMLLLAISIVIAIFVSNWVTAPLRLLQESFSSVKFGKINQQILYDKEDEIGALVKDYNKKLEELQFTAQQLALSERESAWREMAKQVAHEIKNPLTPMKLSVQQLLRVYNPDDPQSEMKLKKVSESIIEQIDALTKIANEFSSFAKMPKPNEVHLDLIPLLENVIEVFRSDAKANLSIETFLKQVNIKADKDQMVRVFNNLIQNAIQAIPEDREGKINIRISEKESVFLIHVMDNGKGIETHEKGKIFVPYFTTKSTGTGLGLAMVKQIIENHNGQINFQSSPLGTTFTIQLPIDRH